jgi:hypothetical protein
MCLCVFKKMYLSAQNAQNTEGVYFKRKSTPKLILKREKNFKTLQCIILDSKFQIPNLVTSK